MQIKTIETMERGGKQKVSVAVRGKLQSNQNFVMNGM